MRIAFRKISDERHALEIARDDGRCERVECETRSYLVHDLLHYAVESEARLDGGFWGSLAKGKTLSDMNDRTGKSLQGELPQIAAIEGVVGPMSMAVKGRSAAQVVAGFDMYATAMDSTKPEWLTEAFVLAVQTRMRKLMGAWKATSYGGVLWLDWPHA